MKTIAALLVLASVATAQPGKRHLTFSVSTRGGAASQVDPFSAANQAGAKRPAFEVKRGETFEVVVTATPEAGWHTYPLTKSAPNQEGKRPELQIVGGDAFQPLYPIQETEPKWKQDKALDAVYLYHPAPVTWTQRIYVKSTAPEGKTESLVVKIAAQVCKGSCVDEKEEFALPVTIATGPATPASAELTKQLATPKSDPIVVPVPKDLGQAAPPPTAPTSTKGGQLPATLAGSIVAAMLGGFLSLLTPCVFPMIPITVSFFLKQSETKKSSAVLMAVVYSGTIMLVLALGGLALMETLTRVINHWATNFIIGALFLYFALSLLGWYDITLPSWLQDATAAREGKGGMAGAFFMALTFSIISFACVGPIYGGFLTTAATQTGAEAQVRRVLSVFAFSGAFASPFFLLAVFPGLLKTMPRAGSWMNSVKVVMGFLELAAVVKFVRTGELLLTGEGQYLSYPLAMAAYAALSFACALYLFGVYRLPHDHEAPEHIGVARLLFSLTFLGFGLYFLPGVFKVETPDIQKRGKVYFWVDGFLLPDPDDGSGKDQGGPSTTPQQPWLSNLEEALALARKENKQIFLDFTGVSCTNCKVNERVVFPRADVQQAFSRHVLLKLYTDTVPAGKKQLPDAEGALEFRNKTFGSGGLPLYAIIKPTASSFEVVGVFGQDTGLIEKSDIPNFLAFLGS